MDAPTAFKIFEALDSARMFEGERGQSWHPPTYEVRLDGFTVRATSDRAYRIRVTPGSETGGIEEQDWRYVLDQANEHDCSVTIENNGMVLL